MPTLTAQATTFRTTRYQHTGYLSTIPQTVVLRGTLSATPTFPTLTLAYTNVSGSHTNVTTGMTVRVLSGGVLKGLLRIATGGTIGAASLPVNEFSANTCNAASGDTIEVVKENRIWDKLVSATAAFLKDSRIAYTDQLANPPPVANSGGAYANFADLVTGGVNFYGATSWVVDPDSAGTMTHAWSFPGATPSSSTDTDPTGIVLATGFTLASHTVTDSGNSKTTTQYVPIWIHDRTGADAPLSVVMENMSASVESGWSVTFSLPVAAQADIDAMPDGALICYWEEERYNTTVASYGSNVTGRGHIKFVGYLVRSTIHIDAENDTVTFDAVSPLGKLEQTPALPQLMINDATPANWQEVKTLTIKRALWYLLYWGSTYTDIFDFVWADGNDLSYTRLAIQETGSLAAQSNDLMGSVNATLTCDRNGRLLVYEDGDFLSSAERSARTKVYDLTTADIVEIDIPKEHVGTTKHVRGEAITTGGAPVFANAGNAPSSIGTGSDTLGKQIVSNQADINTRTGLYFAKVNGLYDGRFVPRGATVTLHGAYDVFDPAYRDFLTITLADTTNKRGESFSTSQRWSVKRVDIQHDTDSGKKVTRLTLDHETTGASGVTYIPPQASESGYDFPPLDLQLPWLGLLPEVSITGITPILAVFSSTRFQWDTADFMTPESAGGPTWTSTALTGLTNWPGGSALVGFTVDAHSAAYLSEQHGLDVDGWLLSDTHVIRYTDLFNTKAMDAAEDFALHATTLKRTMQFERGQQNWGVIASWYTTEGVWAAVTTDGVNWTEAAVTAHYNTSTSQSIYPGVYVSPHVANKAYVSVWTSTGAAPTTTLYKTTDAGANWSALTTPTVDTGIYVSPVIVIAFQDTSETTIFHRYTPGNNPTPVKFHRTTAAGAVDITPVDSGTTYAPVAESQRSFAIQDDNKNHALLVGGTYGDIIGVWTTKNLFAASVTWENIVAPSSSTPWRQVYAIGKGMFILLGNNGNIALVDADGNIDVKTGNMTSAGNLFAVCGG